MSRSTNPTPTPRPHRQLIRSPSDPVHLSQAQSLPIGHGHGQAQDPDAPTSPNRPIYVLTADGSSLFLLDPTKPQGGEEPPPYASFTVAPSEAGDGHGPDGTARPMPDVGHPAAGEEHHGARHRARTLSAIHGERATRPRYHSSLSHPNRRTRSALSTPEAYSVRLADETTPLLGRPPASTEAASGLSETAIKTRGAWRSVCCGDVDADEQVGGWAKGWKRFWRPVTRGEYWRAMLHLVLLNFPFALFVWPPLLAGTLAGTALLITLPIGAAVWWLTLFISRSAARLETIMQLHHHKPLSPTLPPPIYHPIFYRLLPRSTSTTPLASPTAHQSPPPSWSAQPPSPTTTIESGQPAQIWEKRFLKCSYAMFLDHYSYSALSYFLLIKPLITLFSTIVVLALLPVAFVTIFGLPVYLRLLRRWGRWQAEVAIENL
ncbi:hypothetical protein IAU60_005370 [Kwoniella sp. DSM 27419]